jgi:hypothetical protein
LNHEIQKSEFIFFFEFQRIEKEQKHKRNQEPSDVILNRNGNCLPGPIIVMNRDRLNEEIEKR